MLNQGNIKGEKSMDEKSLKFAESHEWLALDGDVATIGISNHAQGELGDIVYIEFKEKGEEVEQFEECGSLESVKAVSEIKSPISGEVIEINNEIIDKPEIINSDPYNKGWVAKIKISDESELDKLMDFEAYQKFIEED